MHDLLGREHAAVGLHHVERDVALLALGGGELAQTVRDVADVVADVGLDRGVDEGRDGPLVLAVLAQHLAGDAHGRLRVLLHEDVADAALVFGVGVGVHEAHADGEDLAVLEEAGGGADVVLVQGTDLAAS